MTEHIPSDSAIISRLAAELPEPCNVSDIDLKPIPEKELETYLNVMKTMSTEELNVLITGLGKANAINPNENRYYSTSKKQIAKYFFNEYKKREMMHQNIE